MKAIAVIGLDELEYSQIKALVGRPVVAHELLPRIRVDAGRLWVEGRLPGSGFIEVGGMVYHGIFEHDLEFLAALALWDGPCLPGARGMMAARMRLPGLVRALDASRFAGPARGYVSPDTAFAGEGARVAKWGNWHCGENKERFNGVFQHAEGCLIEPFIPGRSVRIAVIGEKAWQIELAGADWKKSIHDDAARFVEPDAELVEDTRAVGRAFGVELLANDYIVADSGSKHLLEMNHIPNVTRFAPLWDAYLAYVVEWARRVG